VEADSHMATYTTTVGDSRNVKNTVTTIRTRASGHATQVGTAAAAERAGVPYVNYRWPVQR
jgi:hypothetical protein